MSAWLSQSFPVLFSSENALLRQAREARWLPPWWAVLLVTIGVVLLAQIGGGLLYFAGAIASGAISLPNPEDPGAEVGFMPQSAAGMAALLVLSFGGIYVLLFAWTRFAERRSLMSLGFGVSGPLRRIAIGLAAGLGLFSLSTLVPAAFGFYVLEEQPLAWAGALLLFCAWGVQGTAEELLLRGWMLPVLGARYNWIAGVLVSSAAFAILHGLNPNIGPVAVLNLALFGLLTAFWALREGGIFGVSALHVIWNWSQTNLYGLSTSGMRIEAGLLMDWEESGPDWLTGGAFGPEGGLAVSAALLLSIAWLLWISRRAVDSPEPQAGTQEI